MKNGLLENWVRMPGTKAPRICIAGDIDWPVVITTSGPDDKGIEQIEKLIALAPKLLKIVKKVNPHLISNVNALGDLCDEAEKALEELK